MLRVAAGDDAFDWRDDNLLWWRGAPVARLLPGADRLRPQVGLLPVEHVGGPPRERARRRLADWLERRLADGLQPLARLAAAKLQELQCLTALPPPLPMARQ